MWIKFAKKNASVVSIGKAEAIETALCFGWIDGVGRSLGAEAHTIRFTPRKARSTWSLINVRRVAELTAAGLMRPAGLAAFEARAEHRTGIYSSESEERALPPDYEEQFRGNAAAWAFWLAQPPGYRKTATFWVVTAKQQATRERRLARLIEDSGKGRRLDQLTSPGRRAP